MSILGINDGIDENGLKKVCERFCNNNKELRELKKQMVELKIKIDNNPMGMFSMDFSEYKRLAKLYKDMKLNSQDVIE